MVLQSHTYTKLIELQSLGIENEVHTGLMMGLLYHK
jgi:hypothetical protein